MDDLRIDDTIVIPGRELKFAAVRASGPGGQNVNKVSSKVELRLDLMETTALPEDVKGRLFRLAKNRIDEDGVLLMTSQKTRDQPKNLEDAREKLAELIRAALFVPKPRKKTKPTRSSKRRRVEGKRLESRKKDARRAPVEHDE